MVYIIPMKNNLSPQYKTFFRAITRSISTNPFQRERLVADMAALGAQEGKDVKKVLNQLIARVEKTVHELSAAGCATIRAYEGEDRELITNLFVFHVFHQYLDALDRHILSQNKTDNPITLACGNQILSDLEGYGFTPDDADTYLALFFQMRRGYFFINNSLIGTSPPMEELRARMWNTIFTRDINLYVRLLWNRLEDFSTLLLGETGCGKGLVAAAIGRSGYIPYSREKKKFTTSFTQAFLSINLSQFPEQLIESELFGHARGAFTGAIQPHRGIFSRSSPHGSVFLDEIGEVAIPVQVKLLRILQDRNFSPVGSEQTERFAGRVIAATNRNLDRLRAEGHFRNDFFYRLSSDIITIAPLRERLQQDSGELRQLTTHLLERIVGTPGGDLTEKVVEAIHKHPGPNYQWPGNVRELEQCIRQILLHGEYMQHASPHATTQQLHIDLEAGMLTVAEINARYCRMLFNRLGSYQAVARQAGLDRRTVKKYIEQ